MAGDDDSVWTCGVDLRSKLLPTRTVGSRTPHSTWQRRVLRRTPGFALRVLDTTSPRAAELRSELERACGR